MAVHLTRIYTRTGDDGTTGLSDFSRIPKTDPRLVAYADCDETNAAIGAVLALGRLDPTTVTVLNRIQNELFDVGADLATPLAAKGSEDGTANGTADGSSDGSADRALRVTPAYIDRLEAECDDLNAPLAALDSFVLPGGTPAAALLHVARTVTRRAERSAWAQIDRDPDGTNVLTARYLNRLSDLLFILARRANPDGDVTWKPGGTR